MYRESVTWKPMTLAVETERLTLRLRDERDAAWYRELVGERGEDMPTLEEATARLARFRDLTIETGIGALAICRREEGDVIGYCALVVGRSSLDEPEIAYELLRRFHGHGYATEAARALVDRELEWASTHGRKLPAFVEVGVMLEAPALAWCIPELKGRADFLSIGTNDLMQYFFAADRNNARVSDRYDILSAPALRFLGRIREDADAAGLPVSICGEAAGRPLEALAFTALGFRRLSMPASGIGPVKRLILSADARAAEKAVSRMLLSGSPSIRDELTEFAAEHGCAL